MDSLPPHMRPEHSFQGLILTLQRYWADRGCVILQPYDMEVGAGTSHVHTFLRAIGPEPWRAAYVQPSRRPKDGRYGENPNRLQHYYQYQVVLKPERMQAYKLSVGTISTAIQRSNNDVGGSVVELSENEYMVRSRGYLKGLKDLSDVPVGVGINGTPIMLADVAHLPVSTTQVLSSGVAGTMAANKSGVQGSTCKKILLAWALTLPACVILAGVLFTLGRVFTG